jgi:heme-degrading monooxygenase HmoA
MSPILVLNAISGVPEVADWIAESFTQMLSTLDGVKGVGGFSLRRLDHPGPRCLYVSVTHWESRSAFDAWAQGEAFRQAHSGCMIHQQDPSRRLTSLRYDIERSSLHALSPMDTLLSALLTPDMPELMPANPNFIEVTRWTPRHQAAGITAA